MIGCDQRARNERFRNGDILRCVFERVMDTCIAAGLVGAEGLAVNASLIVADANKPRSIPVSEWATVPGRTVPALSTLGNGQQLFSGDR